MSKCVKIANKVIGDGYPCFIIAEIGINHNGSVNLAKKMIDDVPINNVHRDDLRNMLIKNKGKQFDELLARVDSETYINKLTYKMYIEKYSK